MYHGSICRLIDWSLDVREYGAFQTYKSHGVVMYHGSICCLIDWSPDSKIFRTIGKTRTGSQSAKRTVAGNLHMMVTMKTAEPPFNTWLGHGVCGGVVAAKILYSQHQHVSMHRKKGYPMNH